MKTNRFMKKAASLVLALSLAAGLLSGCGKAGSQAAAETAPEPAEAEQVPAEITLDSIAELNGCGVSDLLTLYDEEGHLTFIGDRLSDEQITDADSAQAFLQDRLSGLLDLDGITLYFLSDYTSAKTGVTYYRFIQTLNSDLTATPPGGDTVTVRDVSVKFLSSSLKLGVDTDGYPIVVSADLSYDEPEYDAANLISFEEARDIVLETYPDANIYYDYSVLSVWQDNSAVTNSSLNSSNTALCYLVYADDPDAEEEDCEPYICYVVRAERTDNPDEQIITEMVADTLTEYDEAVENTTLSWFSDLKDAGEYTYTVNIDWMNESDREYTLNSLGCDTMEVTVPVMYCETDGLYYLGQRDHYITMSNYVDAMNGMGNQHRLNCYVTDDPEELSAWHFEIAENEEYNCTYADDPNYVIAAFAEYVKVVNRFGEEYDIFESYPEDSYLLLTYALNGGDMVNKVYPTDVTGFVKNAANGGQIYDWQTFVTSPNLAACLDDVVMSHEFTHGVNQHFTTSQYANEQGAVMEGLADMVGYEMAYTMNPGLADNTDWTLGGYYCEVIRVLGDPLVMGCPKYKGGIYYANTVDEVLVPSQYADHGGVHCNSGVPNYLGYMFVNGTPEAGEAVLTPEEGRDLWFEVLYLSAYNTDFVDLGALLKYSAEQLDYSAEQQAYIARLIREYGFEDGTVDEEVLDSEDSRVVTIHLDFENPEDAQKYWFCDFLIDTDGVQYVGGGFDGNMDKTFRLPTDKEYSLYVPMAQTEEQVEKYTAYMGFLPGDALHGDITFHVTAEEVEAGGCLTLPAGETVASAIYQGSDALDGMAAETDEATGETKITSAYPEYSVLLTKAEGSADGEYNLCLVDFQ